MIKHRSDLIAFVPAVILALALIFLLLPGVLQSKRAETPIINSALSQRVDTLRRQLESIVCPVPVPKTGEEAL